MASFDRHSLLAGLQLLPDVVQRQEDPPGVIAFPEIRHHVINSLLCLRIGVSLLNAESCRDPDTSQLW